MAKVFISFLGTNRYISARYRLGDKISKPTPFVQEALVELLCSNWEEKDRLIFFLTSEACAKNWKDGGNFSEGLETRLKKKGLTAKIVSVKISEGRSEEEIRKNFRTVIDQLHKEDEVFFDITHSFRSLPMLNLVALNYARALNRLQIKGIYYGAFEALGPPREVEKMPEEQRVAPVFDLTFYALLLDWSFAVDEFTRYGLAERLYELVKGEINPILKETKGRDERAKALRAMIEEIRSLTLSIYTCRCPKIETFTPRATTNLHQDLLSPFDSLFKKIEEKSMPFGAEDPWEKALSAVEWCIEHRLIQQGYTILLEAVITEICRLLGAKDPYGDISLRKFVSALLSVTAAKTPPGEWRGELRERREEAQKIQEVGGTPFLEVAKAYDKLNKMRNDINHCGCKKDSHKSAKLITQLEELYQALKKTMFSLKTKNLPKIFAEDQSK